MSNLKKCSKMSDALSMLGDLPLGTLDQMSDIRVRSKHLAKMMFKLFLLLQILM